MPNRGKFIALEGIDGSGKRTQIEMLSSALHQRGIAHACISFPRYEGFFGRLVARFLNGEFGRLAEIDAHLSALLYSGDRFEAKPFIEEQLAQGKLVLADRYIGSNLAHQTARVPPAKRKEFIRWLKELEYKVYRLPAEDLVIFLRLPASEARRLVAKKKTRHYTKRRRDLLEADLAHLRTAAHIYEMLAKERNWATIDCMPGKPPALLAPEAIHRQLMEIMETRILSTSSAK
jgi:dTMP kinase